MSCTGLRYKHAFVFAVHGDPGRLRIRFESAKVLHPLNVMPGLGGFCVLLMSDAQIVHDGRSGLCPVEKRN